MALKNLVLEKLVEVARAVDRVLPPYSEALLRDAGAVMPRRFVKEEPTQPIETVARQSVSDAEAQ